MWSPFAVVTGHPVTPSSKAPQTGVAPRPSSLRLSKFSISIDHVYHTKRQSAMPSDSVRPAVERLPAELRRHIASFVDKSDAFSLARVSADWQDAAEAAIWNTILVRAVISPWNSHSLDYTGPASDGQCFNIMRALRGRPRRATNVEHLSIIPDSRSLPTYNELLGLVFANLRGLYILGATSTWAGVWGDESSLILLRQATITHSPAIRMTRIQIATYTEWSAAIKACLIFATRGLRRPWPLDQRGLHSSEISLWSAMKEARSRYLPFSQRRHRTLSRCTLPSHIPRTKISHTPHTASPGTIDC